MWALHAGALLLKPPWVNPPFPINLQSRLICFLSLSSLCFLITKANHIQAFINTSSKSTPSSLLYNQVLTVTAKAAESGFQATVTFLPTSLMASYERR